MDNPAAPAGWILMQQADVTADIVMARAEWHPPDFNNETVHRGVTLYQPTD